MARYKKKVEEDETCQVVDDLAALAEEPVEFEDFTAIPRFDFLVYTGSTLTDLACSGRRVRGGGIPGGILLEIFGPSGAGKTALAVEIGASAQQAGGTAVFRDPEARLDMEYAKFYGLDISKGNDYARPTTVSALFGDLFAWLDRNLPRDRVHVYISDSIAALCTDSEMANEENPMGTERAKEFSINCRKVAARLSNNNRLVIFTNQVRQAINKGGFGPKEVVPGGEAVKFYSSLRLRVGPAAVPKLVRKRKVMGVDVSKVVGISSNVYVAKSSIDCAYRDSTFSLLFNYGLDDVRDNLEYIKKFKKSLVLPDGKEYKNVADALPYVEEHRLERQLREQVIDLWGEVDSHFKEERAPKVRFSPFGEKTRNLETGEVREEPVK